MGINLQDLIVPQSQQDLVAALLSALQGVGQVTQAGAGSAAPVGLGTMTISGVPVAAYSAIIQVTSGTPSSPSVPTTSLSIKVSLDGGASWSGTQSSGGASPWILQLQDYRVSAPTGLTLTFTDGPISTSSWVLNESYVFPTTIPNYPLTDFESGSVQRTLIEADALVTSSFSGLISSVTAGGFTELASLPWLILLAQNLYNITWQGPTSTLGQVIITDSASAGPFTIQQGQLWFAAISGNLYQIATPNTVTLPQGGSILVEVQAQNPGAQYADSASSINTSVSPGALITSLPGVTVNNPLGINLGAPPWQAATNYTVHNQIAPGNGFLYVIEPGGVSGSGITGSTRPVFPTVIGQTVVDNPGANQLTWTCYGVNGAADSYIQTGSTPAAGLVYCATGYTNPTLPANIVLRIASSSATNDATGYIGQIYVAVSTDGGLTFGASSLLPPQQKAFAPLTSWQPSHSGYTVGSQIVPITFNGSWFQVTAGSGNSGSTEPAWPTTTGATVADSGLTWTNKGPVVSKLQISAGGSSGPNLANSVSIVFQDSQVESSFNVFDSYIFDTDWALSYGNSAETAQQLATRCQQQWGTLSTASPTAQIEAWAEQASSDVVVADASPDPNGSGAVELYIAGASGGVSTAVVNQVSTYVTARLPIGSSLLNGVAISAQNATITLHGNVYCPAASITTAQTNLAQLLIALANSAGIGNSSATAGSIYFSQVASLIQSSIGTTGHVDNLSMTLASGGTVSAYGDIQLSAGYVAAFAAVSSLTWIGI